MQAQGNPRRTKVERGIYYRMTPNGRRYEITFTDSTGRQRWRVIDGGIREARTARADAVSRLARGERVAPPSTLRLAEVAEKWLETQRTKPKALRPRTLERYETVLRLHVLPRLGKRKVTSINEDDVVALIQDMQTQGLSGPPSARPSWSSRASWPGL